MFASNTSQVSNGAVYVEDVFQSWLSTGNGTSRTVTGPDMTLGGLSITKSRSAATGWRWVDTARGAGLSLESNSVAAQATESTGVTAFTTTGTSIGSDADYNTNGATYVDYLLKKQPKFFDVVTYTGNGASSNNVSHALASQPAFIITKRTDSTGNWIVWHRTGTSWVVGYLNTTGSMPSAGSINASVTSTQVDIGAINAAIGENANISGASYVMYLFAHNAGGFGLTGTDNVISCGSYTGTGASFGPQVDLGYEPQWVMIKAASTTGSWAMFDNMRGIQVSGPDQRLYADTSGAEATTGGNGIEINATGFRANETFSYINGSGQTYIYIAIRRGPMKTPTSGTSVFAPVVQASTTGTQITTNFPIDSQWSALTSGWSLQAMVTDRLRGVSTNATPSSRFLLTSSTAAENTSYETSLQWNNTSFKVPSAFDGQNTIWWNFRRAPGFFDEVCYTGTGTTGTPALTLNHNLTVPPELIIYKKRSAASSWWTFTSALPTNPRYYYGALESSNAFTNVGADVWNLPTSTQLYVPDYFSLNDSGATYVAYLFASCPGVSKVGSYTGNGSTQTINCGFTGGARFVLIKRTDSTGDWYVWDTARGMVSGTDPSLLLNSTAAEVNANSIYTTTGGFQIVSTAAGINASGGSYIFFAVA